MKVFLETRSPALSQAMTRVIHALTEHAPRHIQIVHTQSRADLVVIHTVDHAATMRAVESLKPGQRYAIIQYCLRTTYAPSTSSWLSLWERAQAVWSYYDLRSLMIEDGELCSFNFYMSPLGVDSRVFTVRSDVTKTYGVMTSGYIAVSECVVEAAKASASLGLTHCHLGPNLDLGPNVSYYLGISDEALAELYRRSRLVSGLRRVEGFELPAAEAILCGTRPVLFDRPHYRRWYEPWAEFIEERGPVEVTTDLIGLLQRGLPPTTKTERDEAAELFDWKNIAQGFWSRV